MHEQSYYNNHQTSSHNSFAYRSSDFKQRFSIKVLSTVGVQILATIAIVAFNFSILNTYGSSYLNFMLGVSTIGAICCLLATCSR